MKLTEEYKKNKPLVQWAVASFLVGIIGLLASFQFAGRVLSSRQQMREVKGEISRLQERYDKLEGLRTTFDDAEIGSVVQALPVRNPLLLALSQAKVLANNNSLILDEIVGSPPQYNEATQIYSAILEYEVSGSLDNSLEFLRQLSNSLPVVTIDELTMTNDPVQEGDFINTKLILRVFWSDLPQDLPNITESIETLTEEEMAFLEEIADRIAPSYSQSQTDLEFDESAGRNNPFSSEVIVPINN